MYRCSHCGRRYPLSEPSCPACGQPAEKALLDDETSRWNEDASLPYESASGSESTSAEGTTAMRPIARFGNAAEAGYFAHELMRRRSIPVELRLQDDFDAMSGLWYTWYVLAVAENWADTAAEQLAAMLADEENSEPEPDTDADLFDEFDEYDQSPGFYDETHTTIAPMMTSGRPEVSKRVGTHEGVPAGGDESATPAVGWVPILLTLAAGSVVFLGVRHLHRPPVPQAAGAPRAADADSLWDFLAREPRPWVQRFDNGRGRRELHFQPEVDRAVILEDRDGDGRFERQFQLQRSKRSH